MGLVSCTKKSGVARYFRKLIGDAQSQTVYRRFPRESGDSKLVPVSKCPIVFRLFVDKSCVSFTRISTRSPQEKTVQRRDGECWERTSCPPRLPAKNPSRSTPRQLQGVDPPPPIRYPTSRVVYSVVCVFVPECTGVCAYIVQPCTGVEFLYRTRPVPPSFSARTNPRFSEEAWRSIYEITCRTRVCAFALSP